MHERGIDGLGVMEPRNEEITARLRAAEYQVRWAEDRARWERRIASGCRHDRESAESNTRIAIFTIPLAFACGLILGRLLVALTSGG